MITSSPVRDRVPSRAVAQRHHTNGHARGLKAAFEVLETFPALAQSRDRLLGLLSAERGSLADVIATVESDVALVIGVMRLANRIDGAGGARVESVVEAVRVLAPEALGALAGRTPTFEFFQRSSAWDDAPERHRLHAVATQHVADRLAQAAGYKHRERLMVTSLLHDIGKLVLTRAYGGYPEDVHDATGTPEQRVHCERRELGIDHALAGGVLARRWGLPDAIASAIERHHSSDAQGDAAFIRVADMLAHHTNGARLSPRALIIGARAIGLGPAELRAVMHDAAKLTDARPRQIDPCPLSDRELDVLKRLATGKRYKQIAGELELSTSTVRTHLHNIYRKLDVGDRAQAVLDASRRGLL